MNIRKNIDYSSLYDEIDRVLAADFSQIELYLELGRLVSGKPEKGAAVMAAEYITANYPDRTGFPPRNLRRMRDFYRIYEGHPEVFKQALEVGWTQNIVILEADLDMEGRSWYLRAVRQFGWSSVPNHGSKTMDKLTRLPRWAFRLAGFFVNLWYRLLGDRHPDFCAVCGQFTTAWAEEFNRANPDVEGVLYRSYAGAMRSWRSDLFMCWQNLIIGLVEGENDGLVTAESAQWTGFQGVWRGAAGRGVSHMDEVDFRRRPLRRRGEVFDVVDEYIRMAAQLKELGL